MTTEPTGRPTHDARPLGDDAYLVAHLTEALLADDRLHEQSLEVALIATGRISVCGEVATPERRQAVLDVVRSLAGDTVIVDDLRVSPTRRDTSPEEL